MSDPYNTSHRDQPGTNPPRHVPPTGSNMPFIAGGIAIAVALAAGLWALSHRAPTTAATPPPCGDRYPRPSDWRTRAATRGVDWPSRAARATPAPTR
jgi:hypothetical protein